LGKKKEVWSEKDLGGVGKGDWGAIPRRKKLGEIRGYAAKNPDLEKRGDVRNNRGVRGKRKGKSGAGG